MFCWIRKHIPLLNMIKKLIVVVYLWLTWYPKKMKNNNKVFWYVLSISKTFDIFVKFICKTLHTYLLIWHCSLKYIILFDQRHLVYNSAIGRNLWDLLIQAKSIHVVFRGNFDSSTIQLWPTIEILCSFESFKQFTLTPQKLHRFVSWMSILNYSNVYRIFACISNFYETYHFIQDSIELLHLANQHYVMYVLFSRFDHCFGQPNSQNNRIILSSD